MICCLQWDRYWNLSNWFKRKRKSWWSVILNENIWTKIFEHISASEIKTDFLMYSHAAKAYKDFVTNLLEIHFVHRKALFLQVLIFSIKCMYWWPNYLILLVPVAAMFFFFLVKFFFNNFTVSGNGKISRGIGILCKARKYLMESSLLTLYYAFIYPYFTYCNTVWGNTYSWFLEPLTKLQKRAIQIICGARKYDHITHYFNS